MLRFHFCPYKSSSFSTFVPTSLPLLRLYPTSSSPSHENLSTFALKTLPPLGLKNHLFLVNDSQKTLGIAMISLLISKKYRRGNHENLSSFRFWPDFCPDFLSTYP